MAPSYNHPGIPNYLCGHNLLKAHAKVYHMYKNKFSDQNGELKIVTCFPSLPSSSSSSVTSLIAAYMFLHSLIYKNVTGDRWRKFRSCLLLIYLLAT